MHQRAWQPHLNVLSGQGRHALLEQIMRLEQSGRYVGNKLCHMLWWHSFCSLVIDVYLYTYIHIYCHIWINATMNHHWCSKAAWSPATRCLSCSIHGSCEEDCEIESTDITGSNISILCVARLVNIIKGCRLQQRFREELFLFEQSRFAGFGSRSAFCEKGLILGFSNN